MSKAGDTGPQGAVIGIDLGTTNSVIATVSEGRVRILADAENKYLHPSVVAFMPTGERVVGHRARARRITDPANTIYSAKRIIGRPFRSQATQKAISKLPYRVVEGPNQEPLVVTRTGQVSIVDISATVLIYVRQLAESQLGQPVTRCVVTVPANFSDSQREATRMAVMRAGMTPLRILNEPTAAALAYGASRKGHQRLAIFDLGGGTFDFTLLSARDDLHEVIATAGDPFLGGDDMDHVIADHLSHEFMQLHGVDLDATAETRARLMWAAEEIKKRLTREDEAGGTIANIAHGKSGRALDLKFRVSRSQFEDKVLPLVERAIDVTGQVLEEAGVLPQHVDEVILVGGATLVPLVPRKVAEFFGKEPKSTINPMQVVAAGAAIHAASLSGTSVGGGLLMDVTSHSLGIATAGGYAEFLIEKNTPIPAEGTRVFSPAKDEQTEIRLRICQGEYKKFDQNTVLGELILDDLPQGSRGEVRVEVSFLVDANGILQVSAKDLATGRNERATLSVLGVNPEDSGEVEEPGEGEVEVLGEEALEEEIEEEPEEEPEEEIEA